MVQAKDITAVAAVLIAACLSGCGYATLDSDTTASLNSADQTGAARDAQREYRQPIDDV
jgi:hypothetical protein